MKLINNFKRNRIYLIIGICSSCILISVSARQKVACVGNSITYGYGLLSPDTQSYPAQMQVLLGTTDWEVGNFGISSRTLIKKGNKPYWNETAFSNAKAFNPDIVMIELGTNDAKTSNWNPFGNEFVSNYKEMIQEFQGLSSKPEVWIGLIPPGQHINWTILFGYVRDSVNTRIKQIALESGVGLIDLFDPLNGNNNPWYSPVLFQGDSIHPSTAGAAVIAQRVKEMITLNKPQIVYSDGKLSAPAAGEYQWYYNGALIPDTEGGNRQMFTPLKTGKYKVSVKLYSTNETRIVSQESDITLHLSHRLKRLFLRQ
jgi:acyl-CoA thioesterase I